MAAGTPSSCRPASIADHLLIVKDMPRPLSKQATKASVVFDYSKPLTRRSSIIWRRRF